MGFPNLTRVVAAFSLTLLAATAHSQTPDALIAKVKASPAHAAAAQFLDGDHERFVRELIQLTEIPAPPFKETARGTAYLRMLQDAGLTDVERDAEGNVMGVWKGSRTGGPMLAVLAHLDTVFPEGTDVKVKRTGTRLEAPGVGDDTRGLAMLLTAIRAMRASGLRTVDDILFVGNVGEEGEGDLRGVKYLFAKGKYKDRIRQFIAIDGADQSYITNGAVGSKRYRVTFTGPGGHSYGAFGLVNPAMAMGNAIQKFSRVTVPSTPKTTFNVGVVGGGTSVNSIPVDVFMDVDMRSESPAELTRLDTAFKQLVAAAVTEENQARSTTQGRITAEIKLIGDRPSGTTAKDTMLVQTMAAVVSSFGLRPAYEASSTDANTPISLGIPAITTGSGGTGGRGHSLDEWIDVEKRASVQGALMAITMFVAAAGMP